MRFVVVFLFSLILAYQTQGQELNIDVNINTPKLRDADPSLFTTLENQVRDFLNNTRWTDQDYEPFERIEGNLLITVKEEKSSTNFVADFFFQCKRPVFNSSYDTQVLNYVDKDVPLTYSINQPIRKSLDSYSDNLSSVLTYYAFIMIGLDHDTFSPLGGDPYFSVAENIINSIPIEVQNTDTNWQLDKKPRNRFLLINDLLNPRAKSMRQAIYEYHRLSLDTMHQNPEKARAIMTSSITAIDQVNKDLPNAMIVQMFVENKRDEVIEIYKGASKGEQTKVKEIMIRMDPSQSNIYSAISR